MIKKILFSTVVLLLFTTLSFAQENKMEDRAQKEVDRIDANITAGDPSAALSDSQKKEIFDMMMEKFEKIGKLSKSGKSKEDIASERKELNASYNSRIYQEVFTPEQREANKKGREKNKS